MLKINTCEYCDGSGFTETELYEGLVNCPECNDQPGYTVDTRTKKEFIALYKTDSKYLYHEEIAQLLTEISDNEEYVKIGKDFLEAEQKLANLCGELDLLI